MNTVKVFHIVRRIAPNIKNYSPAIMKYTTKNEKVECNGKNEPTLPKLPVPSLKETLNTYFLSVKPYLNNQECENTKKLLEDFESNAGSKLQYLLEERAKKLNNWLTDWWLDTAYLTYRDPVLIFSSPGQILPPQKFSTEDERLRYAAKIIVATMNFKIKIDNNQIPQEKMGKDLLDMSQYNKVFGTCRQPYDKKDKLVFHPNSKHITIVSNNNYFSLAVQACDGSPFNEEQIFEQLQEIRSKTSHAKGTPIGILTAQNRDKWADSYKKLKSIEGNQKSIDSIESSLFLMCLDDSSPNINNLTVETMGAHATIHGLGSKVNIGNRWYDKTMQFIVGRDGINGITYEHSPSEGQPIATLSDYIVEFIRKDLTKGVPPVKSEPICYQPLPFEINNEIIEHQEQASKTIDKLICDLFIDVNVFKDYGKNFIKQQKLSPDSYFQMAIQLAFYRIHKCPGAHYESASLRKFIDGRTEAIRSCSTDSVEFAKIMLDPSQENSKKVIALRKAVNTHKEYVSKAINGKGCDRHLLGLKLLAIENNLPIPDIFNDVAFKRSTTFRLSTSQVASACYSFMSYGPLVPNGYGCCYNMRNDDIIFAASTFRNDETCVNKFAYALNLSLSEMKRILECATTKAKL